MPVDTIPLDFVTEKLGKTPYLISGPDFWAANYVGQTTWFPDTVWVYNGRYLFLSFIIVLFNIEQ